MYGGILDEEASCKEKREREIGYKDFFLALYFLLFIFILFSAFKYSTTGNAVFGTGSLGDFLNNFFSFGGDDEEGGGGYSGLGIGNDAKIISIDMPNEMFAGQLYDAKVTIENIGTNTWTYSGGYKLGSQNSYDDLWGGSRRWLDSADSVSPNQRKTFELIVAAPTVPSTYEFKWQMVQDGVEWFGEISFKKILVREAPVEEGKGYPAIDWLARSGSGKGVFTIDRFIDGLGLPGEPCTNGIGWQNTFLYTSSYDPLTKIFTRKTISSQCSYVWGSPADTGKFFEEGFYNTQKIPAHWGLVKSSGEHNGQIFEEVSVYPGIILVPENIIADGKNHLVNGCYKQKIYTNYQDTTGSGQCFDEKCEGNPNCPGYNSLRNTNYIVYDFCLDKKCYVGGNPIDVPLKFNVAVESVLRVSYALTVDCVGEISLIEEQWYAKGYGWIGFYNTDPTPKVPVYVDVYKLYESDKCIPFWDGFCSALSECCPSDHLSCTARRSDEIVPSVTASIVNGNSLSITSTDNVGIVKTELFIDGKLSRTLNTQSSFFLLDSLGLENGNYKIQLKVYDISGNYNSLFKSLDYEVSDSIDFSISQDSSSASIQRKKHVDVNVSFVHLAGNSFIVGLQASNLTNGVTATFNPVSCLLEVGNSCYSILNLSANSTADLVNNSKVIITGYNGFLQKNLTFILNVTQESPIPLAPSELEVTGISQSSLFLNWIDNSVDEEHFEVQRKLSTGGTFSSVLGGSKLKINSTNFTDAGLSEKTTYQYRVRAVNSYGPSEWSNTASGTTLACTGSGCGESDGNKGNGGGGRDIPRPTGNKSNNSLGGGENTSRQINLTDEEKGSIGGLETTVFGKETTWKIILTVTLVLILIVVVIIVVVLVKRGKLHGPKFLNSKKPDIKGGWQHLYKMNP